HGPRRQATEGGLGMTLDPRHQSRALVDGADRAAARSYFKAIGFTDEDLKRPLVGVAHCWIEITPCNWNHRKLAEKVKEGVRAAGGTPIEFNSISITDGISMGTEGMKASLVSRETIADSVELVVRGHLLDGFVGISGCDKTIPAMGVNGVTAVDPRKEEVAFETGKLVMEILKKGLLPRQIITRKALHNAIAGVMATGGSTNAVLHLLAIAKEAGVKLAIDEFDKISRKTPLLADMRPWGNYTAPEMHEAGGMGVVAKRLLDAGLLNAGELTVTGKTIGDEARAAREAPGQKVIRPLSDPLKREGGMVILRGNLAPEGCVAKISGQKRDFHRGPARVFEREEDSFAAVKAGKHKPNEVIVIRWEGPKGGPGMREMLHVTGALQGAGRGDTVALMTAGR